MKILNLVNLEKSDIKYKIQSFPDGQRNIIIDVDTIDYYEINVKRLGIYESYINKLYPVHISSRLNNWLDLELIVASVASLRELGVKEIHLYTPYFLGSRSDRKFEEGSNNYLKDVICPIINSLNFKTVTCIDPHSDVLEACLNNFKKKDNLDLVLTAMVNILKIGEHIDDKCILVSPDAGASKKIYKLAEQIGYKGDIITCSKDRDKDGKLTQVRVPFIQLLEFKDIIIIDDICDGGATFINIVKEINKLEERYPDKPKMKKYLIVTHGIFSKGFEELSQYFNGIYCTNSYSDLQMFYDKSGVKTPTTINGLIKQLNVF